VSAPRRYRLALLAFPRTARAHHAEDLLGVLHAADSERGAASWREAAQLLIAGLGLRVEGAATWLTPLRLSIAAGLLCGLGAFAPGSAWGLRAPGPGRYFVIAGPTPELRWALLGAAALALGSAVASRGLKPLFAVSVGAGCGGLVLELSATLRRSLPPGAGVGIRQAVEHGLLFGGVLSIAVLLASVGLERLAARHRVRVTAACVAIASIAALATTLQGDPHAGAGGSSVSAAPGQLGPAGLLIGATAALGGLAALARRQPRGTAH
jgi:hypothetical protein